MLHSKDSIWLNQVELNKGEKIIINAESGKGKTTFTHILSGVEEVSQAKFYLMIKISLILPLMIG